MLDQDTLNALSKMFDEKIKPIKNDLDRIQGNLERVEDNVKRLEGNLERVENNLERVERVHGASLIKIEKEVSSVQDVYKLTIDAVVNTKKNQVTIEQTANQTAANSLAIKKHTQQIKSLELKVG